MRQACLTVLPLVTSITTATAIWPEHNPFVDDHFVYMIVLVGLILANAGRYYGLGKVWQRVGFVQDRRYLY